MQHEITAVTFDAEAFTAWLDGPISAGTAAPRNRDAVPMLATAYQQYDGEAGLLVEEVLRRLASSPQTGGTPVWSHGLGVADVRVWPTAAGVDGPDGGLTGEVTVDGVVLSLGYLTEDGLIAGQFDVMPGYEAAGHALSALAAQINTVAAAFRANRPAPAGDWAFAEMSTADVEAALITLAEYVDNASAPDTLSTRQMEVALQVRRIAGGLGVGTDDEDEDTVVDAELVD